MPECDHVTCSNAAARLVVYDSTGTTRRYCAEHYREIRERTYRQFERVEEL